MTTMPAPTSPCQPRGTVAVGDHLPDVASVVRVSREGASVELTATARQRIVTERIVVERIIEQGRLIYGLTTGLGASVDTLLPPEDVVAFHTRAVLGRSVAAGQERPRGAASAGRDYRRRDVRANRQDGGRRLRRVAPRDRRPDFPH